MDNISVALILNSGIGRRMGDLTSATPKALLNLKTGESILSRQIRLLKDAGIKKIIITTGPFQEQIENISNNFNGIEFIFVHNPLFKTTNNIYSLYLAKETMKEDMIILHGDLVFDSHLLNNLVSDERENLVLINEKIKQSQKDFKGVLLNSQINKITTDNHEENLVALQPIYKMGKALIKSWAQVIDRYITNKQLDVFIEAALNDLLSTSKLYGFDYTDHFVEEIDNKNDYLKVNANLILHEYKMQTIFYGKYIKKLKSEIISNGFKRPFLVHGKHFKDDNIFKNLLTFFDFTLFSDFSPNPTFEEVKNAVYKYNKNHCDVIIALSGGSGIDVAKAVKYYSKIKDLQVPLKHSEFIDIPLIAIPSTAGSGSESTTYSVIYFEGVKQSISSESLLPTTVILDDSLLKTLSVYQRKSTMLDAMCQSIESFWSVKATRQSKKYASKAIELILFYYRHYIEGSDDDLDKIIEASNYAGKAINISETTAPHAMSYGLTKLTGISHGHSVSLTLLSTISFITENFVGIGPDYQKNINELIGVFKAKSLEDLYSLVKHFLEPFNLHRPILSKNEILELTNNVNLDRLNNMPIIPNIKDIELILMKSLKY